jgi:uncharacterized protein DUF1800
MIPSILCACLAGSLPLWAPLGVEQEPIDKNVDWDLAAARHLMNRAGFGAGPVELRRVVEGGRDALLERLFAEPAPAEPFFAEPIRFEGDKRELRLAGPEAIRAAKVRLRLRNRRQQQAYLQDWGERLLSGEDPLRERMTLFWHGHFTTQATKVKDSYFLLNQIELLREHALGNYGDLLRGILRDPAMLLYLDNASSKRSNPNENLARELLELFSLGEGNYSEADVKAVARSLTGYSYKRGEGLKFSRRSRDRGTKTFLGVSADHDIDSIVDVILAQPACGRWMAGKLITYFEGTPPDPERLAAYGILLRSGDYELEPFLRHLFVDPDFYRPQIVGARIQSPIDFLVSSSRRLGLRPHPGFLLAGAGLLGEQLLEPPNVKGWEGGEAWITTSSFMARGNLMGLLLGVLEKEDLRDRIEVEPAPISDDLAMGELESEREVLSQDGSRDEAMDSMEMSVTTMEAAEADSKAQRRPDGVLFKIMRAMDNADYRPRLNLSARLRLAGARGDRAIVDRLCDHLLAIEAPVETRRMLTAYLRAERKQLGIEDGPLLRAGPPAEHLLRRLAHLILSLPEAQLG